MVGPLGEGKGHLFVVCPVYWQEEFCSGSMKLVFRRAFPMSTKKNLKKKCKNFGAQENKFKGVTSIGLMTFWCKESGCEQARRAKESKFRRRVLITTIDSDLREV